MLYSATFYLALSIFILGSVYRMVQWFIVRVGRDAGGISVWVRLWNVIKGLVSILLSRDVVPVARTFLVNVVFQFHILKKDFWRWLMHFNLSSGFLLLFLMHALDDQITAKLFSGYYSTASPFLFLRNLFGAMVLFRSSSPPGDFEEAQRLTTPMTYSWSSHRYLVLRVLARGRQMVGPFSIK
jgi:hypothetical protein